MKAERKYTKLILAIMMSAVIVFLSGCKGEDKVLDEAGIAVYYMDENNSKLITKKYKPVAEATADIIDELTGELMKSSSSYISVLKDSVDISSKEFVDGKLKLTLNEEYEKLTAADKLFLRAALVLTYTQVEGVSSVEFFVGGESIKYSDGTVIGALDNGDFVDVNNDDINNYSTKNLNLYFSNLSGTMLRKVTVECVCSNNVSLERYVIEQLIEGTTDENCLSTLSANTKINNIVTKDGVCYVDFAKNIVDEATITSDVVIYSIVNSLSELEHITKVQISVDGETDIVYGSINLSETLSRNLDIVENKLESKIEE